MAKKQKNLGEITKKFGDERQMPLKNIEKGLERLLCVWASERNGVQALWLWISRQCGWLSKNYWLRSEFQDPTVALHTVAQAQKEGGIAATLMRSTL